MGNHEYCLDCGASDFHYGKPCDPARKAKHDAEEKAMEDARKLRLSKLKELIPLLTGMDYEAKLNEYDALEVRYYKDIS